MSKESQVEVVRIGKVGRHPNADSLSITQVLGKPVIFRTGEFNTGDLAVYVPVDSVVPTNDQRWSWLGEKHSRVKAKKLRGIFSMGLLTPAETTWAEGQIVDGHLSIKKYIPPAELFGGNKAPDPGFLPHYDIESLRRFEGVLQDGEDVSVTEKVHGANGRWAWHDGRFWVASHTCFKQDAPGVIWWEAARAYGLEEKLKATPGIGWYGEVFGWVQDLRYGAKPQQLFVRMFDAFDITQGRWLARDEFTALAASTALDTVPELYRGPYDRDKIVGMSVGPSTICRAHCREGVVIKPVTERWNPEIGRVILKYVGEDYLLRKAA